MKRALLGLVAASLAATALFGCGSGTSTPIAPDVQEPDNRNVSGAEILKRKMNADAQKGP